MLGPAFNYASHSTNPGNKKRRHDVGRHGDPRQKKQGRSFVPEERRSHGAKNEHKGKTNKDQPENSDPFFKKTTVHSELVRRLALLSRVRKRGGGRYTSHVAVGINSVADDPRVDGQTNASTTSIVQSAAWSVC